MRGVPNIRGRTTAGVLRVEFGMEWPTSRGSVETSMCAFGHIQKYEQKAQPPQIQRASSPINYVLSKLDFLGYIFCD